MDVNLVARQPKARSEAHGMKKTERVQILVTTEGLDILDSLAAQCGVSRSEFVERSARWIADHFDGQLKRDLSFGENEHCD